MAGGGALSTVGFRPCNTPLRMDDAFTPHFDVSPTVATPIIAEQRRTTLCSPGVSRAS